MSPHQTSTERAPVEATVRERVHLVIEAGPGTGKTWTLMRRIRSLAETCGDGQRVAGVTFTRRAADELRERLAAGVAGTPAEKIWCGTLHGLAWMILKEHRGDWGGEGVRLADPEEIAAWVRRRWKAVSAAERRRRLEAIGLWKALASDECPSSWSDYQTLLQEEGCLDFDDCLLRAWRLFEERPEIGRDWARRFPHVCVDEFQDINPIQYEWLRLWARYGSQLTVVGDPRQAIYGFRGADAHGLERFKRDFSDVRCMHLNESRRCPELVLQAAEQVLQKAGIKPAGLRSGVSSKGRIHLFAARSPREEAVFIARRIERLVGGFHLNDTGRLDDGEGGAAQYGFGEIAVLFRLHVQARPLMDALQRAGIPFVCACRETPSGWEEEWLDHWCMAEHPAGEKVKLMTLHAAKGLEFRVVFIVGCEEGIVPLDLPAWRSEIEEEARLLYVGLTRASEEVYLSHCTGRMLYGEALRLSPSPLIRGWDASIEVHRLKDSVSERRRNRSEQLQLFRLKPSRR